MIKLIAIGKNKDKALQSLEKEYMKRLSAFCKFSEIEVKDEANEHISREAEVLLVKEKEGNRVLETNFSLGPRLPAITKTIFECFICHISKFFANVSESIILP